MLNTQERVILVDENDNQLGVEEKITAHKKGLLHRAFSIFIFDSNGRLLMQKRAAGKYHSGGLWTNTCCSHPRAQEKTADAAGRRLKEEMGIQCDLIEVRKFIYRAPLDGGMVENEFDHVFSGIFNKEPFFNPAEAEDYKWISLAHLKEKIKNMPEKFTPWFKIIIEDYNSGKIPKFDVFWKKFF